MSKLTGQVLRDLESLCFEMSEVGSDKGNAESLEAKLLNHSELQDEFCSLTLLDLLLKMEFSEISEFRPLVEWKSNVATKRAAVTEYSQSASRLKSEISSYWSRHYRRISMAACVAATLAILGWGSLSYWGGHESLPAVSDTGVPQLAVEQMELRNQDVTRLLYQVSNTSWDQGAEFTTAELKNATTQLSQGTAGLGKFNSKDAGGYIVALPPGAVLNLTVHADAAGENALSVIGLDRQGNTTGEVVSFSNQANSASVRKDSTIYGRIGIWSELNDGPITKFYLLTGLHNILSQSGEMDWQVTDFRAFLELPHLRHIGWDDTDWTPKTLGALPPDKDYDDITVTIRIEQIDGDGIPEKNLVLTYPEKEPKSELLEPTSSKVEYPVTVLPRESVILTVSSKAHYPAQLTVVEQESRRVWWQRQSKTGEESHLGVLGVENYSSEPLNLSLVGRHKLPDTERGSEWISSSYRKRLEDDVSRRDHCQMIGFEDFGGDVDDYNDIRVNMHWSNLRVSQ